jgi:hypothetical protein
MSDSMDMCLAHSSHAQHDLPGVGKHAIFSDPIYVTILPRRMLVDITPVPVRTVQLQLMLHTACPHRVASPCAVRSTCQRPLGIVCLVQHSA